MAPWPLAPIPNLELLKIFSVFGSIDRRPNYAPTVSYMRLLVAVAEGVLVGVVVIARIS